MKWSVKEEPEILYHDNHLLVVFKPPGWVTQKEGEGPALDEWVKEWIRVHYHKKGAVFAHPIHRLDKPAIGLSFC